MKVQHCSQCYTTERRALREIDQERTLRRKAGQALAELRTALSAVQAEATATRRLAVAKRRAPVTRTKFKPGPA